MAAAAVVFALSGCGGPAEPTATDTPTDAVQASDASAVSPTPTPTPTATATVPANATPEPGETQVSEETVDPKLAAEATAFVKRYMAANDEAGRTGDFSAVARMYDRSCGQCQLVERNITAIYRDGNRLVGGEFSNSTFSASGGPDADSVLVRVTSTVRAYKILTSAGDVVESHPAEQNAALYLVGKNTSGTWQVLVWS